MNNMIQSIPIDNQGNLLFIKDFEVKDGRMYLDYKSGLNDIPFTRTEVYIVTERVTINGNDGTVLYRFDPQFLDKIIME